MTNELQVQESQLNALVNGGGELFSTLPNDGSRKSKVQIFNTLQNPNHALSDKIGEVIKVVHVMAHPVELVAEETGEIESHMRVILIDENGVSYATVSGGITSALKQIFAIVGQPPYLDEPLELKVLQKKGNGNRKFLTLELI